MLVYQISVSHKSMFGCVTPLGWLISVYKSNVEHLFLESWVNMARWTSRSRSMTPIYNISQEKPEMHLWCKFDGLTTIYCVWVGYPISLCFLWLCVARGLPAMSGWDFLINLAIMWKSYVDYTHWAFCRKLHRWFICTCNMLHMGMKIFFIVGVWPNTCKFSNLSWLGVQVSQVDLTCWAVLPPLMLFSWIRHMV